MQGGFLIEWTGARYVTSEGDDSFGATKLNKLLFYSDFMAFAKFGEPITGQDYQKLEHGPAPCHLLPVQNSLVQERAIRVEPVEYHGLIQNRCVALRPPDMSSFNNVEIKLLDEVIQGFWGKIATYISDKSHRFVGWKLAEFRETIPYEVALVGWRPPTDKEPAWGQELSEMARECLSREA